MSVAWNTKQRAGVEAALAQYDLTSARCEKAAAAVLPIATEVDACAVARRCTPLYGQFVSPKRRWFYHVNVHAAAHYVDALTGTDGMEEEVYLKTHWPDPDALRWDDLTEQQLKELSR